MKFVGLDYIPEMCINLISLLSADRMVEKEQMLFYLDIKLQIFYTTSGPYGFLSKALTTDPLRNFL